MRIALIADVHANLPALAAALSDIRRHAPDRIVSLGDQINLGPCPRETLALLKTEGVECLSGNHEGYVLAAMDGDARYAGANFESLRFNAALLRREEIAFPAALEVEGATLCHALPDDDRFPLSDPERALPLLRARGVPQRETHIVCGHAHNPMRYRLPNLTIDVIGAAGCMNDGVPGMANYAILDTDRGATVLCPYATEVDTRPLRAMFLRGGMAERCPVMARLMCYQMEQNREYLLPFLRLAMPLSRAHGEERMSLETWREADARFDWPEEKSTAAFWREAGSR